MGFVDEIKDEVRKDGPAFVQRLAEDVLEEIVAIKRAHGGASVGAMSTEHRHRVIDLLIELVGGPAAPVVEAAAEPAAK